MAECSVTVEQSKVTDPGLKAAVEQQGINSQIWGTVLSGILTAIGAYKQYQMYEQMGDLAQAQAESTKSLQKINEDVHNKIVLPQHEKSKDFFWNFLRTWARKIEQQVIDCGLKYCEYEGDPDEDTVSNLADAADFIKSAELALARSTSPYAIGECCDNKFRMASLKATLFANTKNNGRKYYRELKLRYDSLYWQKQLGAAQIAQNTQQIGANLLVNAGSQVLGSLGEMARAAQVADQSVQSQFSALGAQAGAIGSATNNFNSIIGSYYGNQRADARDARMFDLLGRLNPSPVATRYGQAISGGVAGVLGDGFPGSSSFSRGITSDTLASVGAAGA